MMNLLNKTFINVLILLRVTYLLRDKSMCATCFINFLKCEGYFKCKTYLLLTLESKFAQSYLSQLDGEAFHAYFYISNIY